MPPSHSDDIPEALRDSTPSQSSVLPSSAQSSFPILWIGAAGIGAIVMGAVTALLWQPILTTLAERGITSNSFGKNNASAPSDLNGNETGNTHSSDATSVPTANPVLDDTTDYLLGHRHYDEAPEDALVPVVADGSVRLREAAATSFTEMASAARAEGIQLQPLSGFRSVEEQEYLFFQVKKDRKQSTEERASVSAPPGYSEHHTGYAVDIGDPGQPDTHLEANFADTDAFKWLEENAATYGFELSFEGTSNSTVNYEPWHWRFVGDRDSLETFYGNSQGTGPDSTSTSVSGTTENSTDTGGAALDSQTEAETVDN